MFCMGHCNLLKDIQKKRNIQVDDLDDGYNAHVYKKIHGGNKLQVDDLDDGYKKHCIQVI